MGEEFYGYYPMASHVRLTPGRINAGGFVDVAEHRAGMPAVYDHYLRVAALGDFVEGDRDWWPVFRPLYLTGWLIADQFEDEGDFGADQVLVASASSKTAIGFAHAMNQRERPAQAGRADVGAGPRFPRRRRASTTSWCCTTISPRSILRPLPPSSISPATAS